MGHKAGRVVTGHGHNDLAARLFVLRGKVIAQLLHGASVILMQLRYSSISAS